MGSGYVEIVRVRRARQFRVETLITNEAFWTRRTDFPPTTWERDGAFSVLTTGDNQPDEDVEALRSFLRTQGIR